MSVAAKSFDEMLENCQARGVEPLRNEISIDGEFIPTTFRCLNCGLVFAPNNSNEPDGVWYDCPHGCNKVKS